MFYHTRNFSLRVCSVHSHFKWAAADPAEAQHLSAFARTPWTRPLCSRLVSSVFREVTRSTFCPSGTSGDCGNRGHRGRRRAPLRAHTQRRGREGPGSHSATRKGLCLGTELRPSPGTTPSAASAGACGALGCLGLAVRHGLCLQCEYQYREVSACPAYSLLGGRCPQVWSPLCEGGGLFRPALGSAGGGGVGAL